MTTLELTQRRLSLGLTKKALAAALGLSRQTVYQWEKGRQGIPTWVHLALLGLETGGKTSDPAIATSLLDQIKALTDTWSRYRSRRTKDGGTWRDEPAATGAAVRVDNPNLA